jgi:hypothetical protein
MAWTVTRAWILLPLLALGCGSRTTTDSTSGGPDLPTGWEDAEKIVEFLQGACEDDPYGDSGSDDFDEWVSFTGARGQVWVLYNDAHFRCAQEVEGFYRRGDGTLDVLVQPVDMDPDAVAGCDCAYFLTIFIKHLPAGELAVSVFRRWDNLNDPNDPVLIATETVTVT